jgi:ATP-dependent helicase/nuclease subunit A
MINGRVDRLIVTDKSVLIIDFKSDRPAPKNVSDVGKTYTAQMAAYRAVLESAYPQKKIRCALVWTDGPQLMELDDATMDAALLELK